MSLFVEAARRMSEMPDENTRAKIMEEYKHLDREEMIARGLISRETTMEELTDKCILALFSFLPPKEVLKCARVCRRWKKLTEAPELWKMLSFRPGYENGLMVTNHEKVFSLIGTRFAQVRLIELTTDLINPAMLTELANKCPKLVNLTLDFSTAAQLADFADLQTFPSRLKAFTICLSENIFLEGLLRKIYTFISSLEILHIVGTYEKIEDEEEEVYETVNLHKIKTYTPNLVIINLWGVAFITDEHVDSLSASFAKLECLAVNYCHKVTGTSFKNIATRCKQLTALLCAHTSLNSAAIIDVPWEQTKIDELDVSATELTSEALSKMLTRLPLLRWLKAAFLEYFNDAAMQAWMDSGTMSHLLYLDIDTCDQLNEPIISELLNRYGPQFDSLNLGGHHKLTENFWTPSVKKIPNIRFLCMGIAEDCCAKVTAKIHVDQIIDSLANNCQCLRRIEIRWDDGTLRFAEKSSKFIDILRMKCQELHSITLSDGKYYELVRSNCERAGRMSVVRTTEMCHTSIYEHLRHYRKLLFN